MRQIRYNDDNLSLFYFTPFVVIENKSDHFVFIHTLNERYIYLKGEEQRLYDICEALKGGVTGSNLISLLSYLENYNTELMDFLIQEGVIE